MKMIILFPLPLKAIILENLSEHIKEVNLAREEGISGEKGEGFVGTIIEDTWTITGVGVGVVMGKYKRKTVYKNR